MSLPVRKPMAGRRGRRGVRRPRLLNWTRVAGLTLIVLAVAGFSWLGQADEFQLEADNVALSGLAHTEEEVVREAIQPLLNSRPSLFRISATQLERRVTDLPAVADAHVELALPDRLLISVVERVPVLSWQVAGQVFLVDADGVLLRELADTELPPLDLPIVRDQRLSAADLEEGDGLEPVDREAVLKLAAVAPSLVDSSAVELSLEVEDEEGYVMTAGPDLWRAVFGHYTPTLRKPEIIERQVQCLRSLLAEEGEANVEIVYLAPADDRCGTFLARVTPEPEEDEEDE